MNDMYENDNDISFSVKFVGRIEVVRPVGLQLLSEALASLKNSDHSTSSEGKGKKSKVSLFLSMNGIDILEHETKFMLYTCPLFLVSFCAVHPTLPNHFGFVAQHPASDTYYCYLFRSKKFSHLLVSLIGDAFQASKRDENISRNRDLVVEALRHRNKMLLKENAELKRRIAALTQEEDLYENSFGEGDEDVVRDKVFSEAESKTSAVRFQAATDRMPLLRRHELRNQSVEITDFPGV